MKISAAVVAALIAFAVVSLLLSRKRRKSEGDRWVAFCPYEVEPSERKGGKEK